jgi:NADPH-dependent 2,4-dienoyl-CoA reductase/sulfur reductase-like enzyme
VKSVECVVVGGGPAGLAAARAAARAGVQVMLIDENARLGGQFYRQLPAAFRVPDPSRLPKDHVEGGKLIDEVEALGLDVRLDSVVWSIFDGRTVALASGQTTERVKAETLVLAPGAYDRPVPFPGWTLPGVMTLGGAQNLMKAYRVLPGRRVLVVGSGPWLLVVAHYLLGGGAEVAAIVEASPMRGLWRHALDMLPHLDIVQQASAYWREIRAAGVPFLAGHVIRRALGDTEVTGAIVSGADGAWRPVDGTDRTLEVDAIVVGYGFLSSVELPRLAGCEIAYRSDVHAWVPRRTADVETTVPGVFVVGDGAGVAGSVVAREEGALAGLVVARRLGKTGDREFRIARARARGRLAHLASFRRAMDTVYRVGSGLSALADAGTVLCRCEEITVGEATSAIRGGATSPNEVKAWTRAGMGRCQGRLCGPALAHLIADTTGRAVADVGVFTPRPPVKPVPLGALVNEVGASAPPG